MKMLAGKIEAAGADTVRAAARQLAEAEAAEARTGAAVKAAQDQSDRVARRIANLEAERAAIVSRRAGGRVEADDGARLALFAADLEGLGSLLADAERQVAAVQPAHGSAVQAVQTARYGLTHAQDTAVMSGLMAYLGELDAAMLKALGALDAVSGRLGLHARRPAWGATPALYTRLRTLAAQRGEL
jgi:hypothetical protein